MRPFGEAFEAWFQSERPRLMEGLPDFLTGEEDEGEIRGIAWLAFKAGADYAAGAAITATGEILKGRRKKVVRA